MNLEIIVNVNSFEKRVAVLENGKLMEFLVEKPNAKNIVGNIYKGIVKDVLPGMGAAFVDLGLQRTAFLHYTDIMVDYIDDIDGDGKITRRSQDSSSISKYLHPGQEIIVQVQKGPINKKGARLTGQISVPGKFLVFFPNKSKIFVSRKISSYKEKRRLRTLLYNLKEEKHGLIVRTEAENCTDEELQSEYRSLVKSWKLIEKKIQYAKPPCCIFDENNIQNTLVRDLFQVDVTKVVVDDIDFLKQMKSEVADISPELVERIEWYNESTPIFDAFGIEKKIKSIFNSKAYLHSGGNIQIDQAEALVAIDVNTGSFTGKSKYEDTVKKTNLEAAREVARQIRLRDLSGIIIVDFIDMATDENRNEVLTTLIKELKKDRARTKAYPFGPLGLVQLTRKRIRQSVIASYSQPCPYCSGSGRVLSCDSVVTNIVRWLNRAEYFLKNEHIRVEINRDIKKYIVDNPDLIYPNYKFKIDFVSSDVLHRHDFKVYKGVEKIDVTNEYSV